MGEIRYADGNPSPTTLKSDLTEALKEFNTGKGKSLTLGGTLVETPEGMEVDGAVSLYFNITEMTAPLLVYP